jgi:glycosyltransferase involved in cell wall biosynthesis
MNQTYPKISIITPSYNQGQYIEETILSVIGQNYPNLEYIIIDGGSTDNSVEIIKKYEKYLTYWVSEKDSGMYEAIQKGFDKSTGEIMAWINSDDMYHRKAFFAVAKVFSDLPEIEWIQGLPTVFNEEGLITEVASYRRWSKYNIYRQEFYKWIQQESTFWRRSLWEKAGSRMDTSFKYASDFELWTRFMGYSKLYALSTILGGFRVRESNQISKDYSREYLEEMKTAIESIELDIETRNVLKEIQKQHQCLFLMKKFKLDILSVKEKLIQLYDFPAKIIMKEGNFYLSQDCDLFTFYPHKM